MSISNIRKTFLVAVALGAASVANADVVVVVSASSGAGTMTAEQVSDVFLGKSTAFTPVEQAESSPIRDEFYIKVTGKDSAQVKAIWTKLIFTGKAALPKALPSSADVKKALAADPKAIGYIEKGAVDGSVKVVLAP
jgi:ABC-type phosphate transport system substrate-binding protein